MSGSDQLLALLEGPVVRAAQRLIGMHLRSEIDGEEVEVVLTEVEAYGGAEDPASHAANGPTDRNRSMFGPAGTIYVYRSYGMHWCVNIATGAVGEGAAILLRAATPVVGGAIVERRRGRRDHLTDGPGKLAQALGVTDAEDGTNVFDGPLRLLGGRPPPGAVIATPRVGITKAQRYPWRFVLAKPVGP